MLDLSPPSTTPSLSDDNSNTTSSRKTRNSCDACAKSKLRCGKQHPRCERCVLRNQACTYGLARPKGRPRLSHRSPSVSPPCSTGLDLNIFSTLYDPKPTPDMYFDCSSGTTVTSTSTLISPDSQHLEDWQFLDHELNLPFDITTPQLTFTLATAQPVYQMASSTTPASPSLRSSRAFSPSPSNSFAYNQSCTSLMLDTLKELHLPLDYSVPDVDMSECANIGTVLRLNNDAMDKLTSVLECDCPVITPPYFSALVAQAIIKILSWYDKIISDCVTLSSQLGTTFLEFAPFKIDGIELSKSYSRPMVVQVVMNELDRVQTLVGMFARKYCRHHDNSQDDQELSMSLAFEEALRGRLNVARSRAEKTMAG
ncbi:hypothetical protein AtubIFM54640_005809 [Aspergillus tubingensis]|uniref:Zn(2)-C6 fungal-type domain-containing protein n=1 Tax=Aspergillus niger TaxID=5061 RepID=A0A117E1V3_ASPNG|nr:hypothetical protein ASPNIDRAFT_39370 [Aspergillus niger]GLA58005.1 hypothetical protein AtubIFM54640_005809 [Aspergillus tubingensis]GLA91606.1 hypothetical protein AtubIFM57143_005109 [Aspergillus tubingensis]